MVRGREHDPHQPVSARMIARPAATRTRRFGGGRFKAAPASQAADAGLEPQHMATVDTRARAAHATTGGRVEAQELVTVRAIRTSLCFPVRGPAAMAEHLGLAADPATAAGAVGNPHIGGIDRPRDALAGSLWRP